ncbi:type IV pilus biogenesis/stability protein PilW [Pseudoxanthomonas suwonensis 11-1]|uniref:Type IV pilus biogenesis/stability protein PilW n=1 Tax=Pseudoxanthomonas suwonensis (strain 11-1) TaxID=743721 RepID=E6WSM9_PSEUU|nr:type IV pilus biogenesis/stability protein PilW [Pseudoxanthomonas suwonensis]ADV27243.1 type IV pilus biogenesis/stability protein PilW [Pseudoxanthomonas suwonensis 11-1]
MRRSERILLILLGALLLAGCARPATVKSPKIRGAERIAPVYKLGDGADTKRRVQFRDTVGLAAQRLAAGDLAEAERLARRALSLDASVADGHTLMGAIESARGNHQAAGGYYRKAAELAPNDGDVLNNYGAWLCANGFAAESLVWLDRAMAAPTAGSRASALANAGACALRSGQSERAEQDLRKALELEPSHPGALEQMATLAYGQGRLMQARAFAERRLAAAPADASVLQLAVRIEQGLGDRVAASRYQQRLREEFPQAVTGKTGEDPQ